MVRNQRHRSRVAQAATEYMMVVSVIIIAVVGASYAYVPTFRNGVACLADEVSTMLDTGRIGNAGIKRDDGAGAAGCCSGGCGNNTSRTATAVPPAGS